VSMRADTFTLGAPLGAFPSARRPEHFPPIQSLVSSHSVANQSFQSSGSIGNGEEARLRRHAVRRQRLPRPSRCLPKCIAVLTSGKRWGGVSGAFLTEGPYIGARLSFSCY
jgi:hypothetical protein